MKVHQLAPYPSATPAATAQSAAPAPSTNPSSHAPKAPPSESSSLIRRFSGRGPQELLSPRSSTRPSIGPWSKSAWINQLRMDRARRLEVPRQLLQGYAQGEPALPSAADPPCLSKMDGSSRGPKLGASDDGGRPRAYSRDDGTNHLLENCLELPLLAMSLSNC